MDDTYTHPGVDESLGENILTDEPCLLLRQAGHQIVADIGGHGPDNVPPKQGMLPSDVDLPDDEIRFEPHDHADPVRSGHGLSLDALESPAEFQDRHRLVEDLVCKDSSWMEIGEITRQGDDLSGLAGIVTDIEDDL